MNWENEGIFVDNLHGQMTMMTHNLVRKLSLICYSIREMSHLTLQFFLLSI